MRSLYVVLCMLIFLQCQPRNEPTEFVKEEVEQEVRTMLGQYFEDIAKDGLTAEFKYLDSSTDFFWVPPGYASALSYDSVRTILESRAPIHTSIQFKWQSLKVIPLDSDHASYTGIVQGEMIDTAKVKSNVNLIESGVAVRRADGWKLLCGQSAVLPE